MNITQVKEAQKTINEAKKELEQIVKEHLENGKLKLSFICHEDEPFENFTIDINKNELNIMVVFQHSDANDDYEYNITCKEIGILFHKPPTRNECTAQGTLKVTYDVTGKEGVKEAEKLINMRSYLM